MTSVAPETRTKDDFAAGFGLHRWPKGQAQRDRDNARADMAVTRHTCCWCPGEPGILGTFEEGKAWAAEHRRQHHPKARDRGQFARTQAAKAHRP